MVTIKKIDFKIYSKLNEKRTKIVHYEKNQKQKKAVLEENEQKYRTYKSKGKLVEVSPATSVVTLNVNE